MIASGFRRDAMEPVVAFLQQWEPFTTNISHSLRRGEVKRGFTLEVEGGIQGIVAKDDGGLLLPFVNPAYRDAAHELMDNRWQRPHFGSVKAIMGERESCHMCIRAISRKPSHHIGYDLMQRPRNPERYPQPLADGFELRVARPGDGSWLLPLQRAYEEEEVWLPGHTSSSGAILRQLEQAISIHTVLVLQYRGLPVAKAQTNALGYGYAQIGGVFTVTEYRGLGYARVLMDALEARLAKGGYSTSLFVKPNNQAAQRLYKRKGYQRIGLFEIVYYL